MPFKNLLPNVSAKALINGFIHKHTQIKCSMFEIHMHILGVMEKFFKIKKFIRVRDAGQELS